MIGEWVRKQTAGCFQWLAGTLAGTGISANAITALGLVLSAVVAYCIALEHHVLAGLLLIAAGGLDGLDGSLARLSGQITPFGAFWDSTLDRLSESVIFFGVLLFYLAKGAWLGVILVYVAAIGSLLVSYVRSKAEGLGISCRIGFMTRFERVFVLTIGLLSGQLMIALWVLAALSLFTVLQRMYVVWAALRQENPCSSHSSASKGGRLRHS
jgi:CDP-diacylglycerol--glycerol-3-phosphate 3-phosphatidyltransferase